MAILTRFQGKREFPMSTYRPEKCFALATMLNFSQGSVLLLSTKLYIASTLIKTNKHFGMEVFKHLKIIFDLIIPSSLP